MRNLWQGYGDYTCRLWQLTVGSDKTRVIAWETSDKLTATIWADSDNWRWALTRPGRSYQKPLKRSRRLYVRTLTAYNGLWQNQADSMCSLWQDHGNYPDNRLWVLTRQCDWTSSLCQMIDSADLAYLITSCCAQILLQSPRESSVSTPKPSGNVEILTWAFHVLTVNYPHYV
jgi:hypothetical protein